MLAENKDLTTRGIQKKFHACNNSQVINHHILTEKYLVEGVAADILASDHYKLHIATEEPLAMAVLRRQTAGIPDIQAEVAHKEALCELAGLHSLYSHPQTNLTCKNGEKNGF